LKKILSKPTSHTTSFKIPNIIKLKGVKKMLEKITIKDIPVNSQDLVQLIGIENFKKLVKYMGGSSIYIPKEKNLTLNLRNQTIKQNFKGDTKTLAKKYKITQSQIRNILKSK
jgi:Mor family transcriptional regulator